MQINDLLLIIAVLLGPVIAVQLTRFVDSKKEERDRKLQIFKTLMATRAYTTSPQHVEALNCIDLEFSAKLTKEQSVVNAWKEYLNLLGDQDMPREQWNIRRTDLFVDLLHCMAQILNYEFDKTHIRNSAYSPVAHSDIENQQTAIRMGIIDILKGEIAIPMYVTNFSSSETNETPILDDQSRI